MRQNSAASVPGPGFPEIAPRPPRQPRVRGWGAAGRLHRDASISRSGVCWRQGRPGAPGQRGVEGGMEGGVDVEQLQLMKAAFEVSNTHMQAAAWQALQLASACAREGFRGQPAQGFGGLQAACHLLRGCLQSS